MPDADYDFLVLGSGIAGLYAALLAAPHGSTCIITKGAIRESNTRYAQGGIAAAVGADDSPERHLADTLRAGAGLCDEAAVRVLVTEAAARIRRLIELGVPFDTTDGAIALGREAAHSLPRILHAGGDRTGERIESTLVRRVEEAGIRVREALSVTALVVEDGRCTGVRGRAHGTGPTEEYRARRVILATGGAGQLYTLTTNATVATGDGIALAFQAGALVRDLEFVQFHPTALALPGRPTFLISEAVRGEGAILRAADGRRFMPDVHPDAELAPRDIVARAIAREMRRTRADHVWLDVTPLDPAHVIARFPGIYQHCLSEGLDLTRAPLPVAPAAHYLMGGVYTDIDGRTTLPGLLACGEVTSTGVHGANRLASNSLLETVVFAQRAVEVSCTAAGEAGAPDPHPVTPFDPGPPRRAPDRHTLQRLMGEDVGIERDAAGLEAAAAAIDGWPAARAGDDPELGGMTLLARLMVAAALARTESRGAHYRRDFPDPSPAWEGRHVAYRRA